MCAKQWQDCFAHMTNAACCAIPAIACCWLLLAAAILVVTSLWRHSFSSEHA